MHALILAAGLGWRLGGGDEQPPKCLLRFDGRSLLDRHLVALARAGVGGVTIGVGYRAGDIHRELDAIGPSLPVETVFNPDFRDGNVVTLHTLAAALTRGEDVLLMDADVLYHEDVLGRLVGSRHGNCLLLDRDFEDGEEPVKLCIADGRPVAFGKQIPDGVHHDLCGESVGFFKLTAAMARRLAGTVAGYLARGARDAFYEDAIRDLMLAEPEAFGFEEVSDVPWIEIDFQEDIRRAEREVMAHIRAREAA